MLRAARAQLRQVATEVLDSALTHLDNSAQKALRGSRGKRLPTAERMREVLERDRAVSKAQGACEPRPEPRAEPRVEPKAVCDEPIRTRTLASLLAAQGYRERALAMYTWLFEQNPGDASLRAEIARLSAVAD